MDISVSAIHSGIEEMEKDAIFRRFRNGKLRCLVTTDSILFRGINFPQVNLVINFEMPNIYNKREQYYIQRIGKVSHFSRQGVVINFELFDSNFIEEIEMEYDIKIKELPENLEELNKEICL